MVPPQGEEAAAGSAGRVEVERARRVAGEAFFRNGHMALDCRRTASMMAMRSNWAAERGGLSCV